MRVLWLLPIAVFAANAVLRFPSAANKRAAIDDLARSLRDLVATVRLASVVSLVAAGVRDFNGEDARYFADAKALYEGALH